MTKRQAYVRERGRHDCCDPRVLWNAIMGLNLTKDQWGVYSALYPRWDYWFIP